MLMSDNRYQYHKRIQSLFNPGVEFQSRQDPHKTSSDCSQDRSTALTFYCVLIHPLAKVESHFGTLVSGGCGENFTINSSLVSLARQNVSLSKESLFVFRNSESLAVRSLPSY